MILSKREIWKISTYDLILFCMTFVIFGLPRTMYIFGIQAPRVIIFVCFIIMCFSQRVVLFDFKNLFLIFIFFVFQSIRLMISGYVSSGLGNLLDTLVLMLVISNLIRSKDDIINYCDLFCAFLTIYSFLGIVEAFSGFNLWEDISGTELSYQRYNLYRSHGAFLNFTNNAYFLMLSMSFTMWMIFISHKKKRYVLTYILVSANLVLTLTRSAILIAILLNIIFLLQNGFAKTIKKHIIGISTAIISILIIILAVPAVRNILVLFVDMFVAIFNDDVAQDITAASFGGNSNGIGHRFILYSWVWDAVSENRIFGLGGKVFEYSYITDYGTDRIKTSIENQYLAILYRYGIVGLCLYCGVLFNFIKNSWRKIRRLRNNKFNELRLKKLRNLIIPALLCYLVGGFSYAYNEEQKLALIMICILNIDLHEEITQNCEEIE